MWCVIACIYGMVTFFSKFHICSCEQSNDSICRIKADVFFSEETLPRAARGAAPVKVSGGFLTFIHKTVQENLVALALCRSIRESCNSTGLSMSKLIKAMLEFYSPGAIGDKQARRRSLSAAAASTTAPTVAEERALARQRKAMVETLVEEVKNSPIGVVALESDPAVRDFIADRLLDDSILAAAAHCVAILAICSESEGGVDLGRDPRLLIGSDGGRSWRP